MYTGKPAALASACACAVVDLSISMRMGPGTGTGARRARAAEARPAAGPRVPAPVRIIISSLINYDPISSRGHGRRHGAMLGRDNCKYTTSTLQLALQACSSTVNYRLGVPVLDLHMHVHVHVYNCRGLALARVQ